MTSSFRDSETPQINIDDVDRRVLVVDRSGSGNVYFLLVNDDLGTIDKTNLDLYEERWDELRYVKDFCVCIHQEYLYVIGGFDQRSKTHLDTAKRYHTVLDIWEDLPSMFHARSSAAALYCNGKIYVTGGERSTGKCTKSCEAFNLRAWCWERVGMMPAARKNHRVATDGSTVFVSGGEGGGKVHACVWLSEEYSWSKMDSDYPIIMSKCRSRHVMELHEGKLYFVAGVTSPKITSLPSQNKELQPEPIDRSRVMSESQTTITDDVNDVSANKNQAIDETKSGSKNKLKSDINSKSHNQGQVSKAKLSFTKGQSSNKGKSSKLSSKGQKSKGESQLQSSHLLKGQGNKSNSQMNQDESSVTGHHSFEGQTEDINDQEMSTAGTSQCQGHLNSNDTIHNNTNSHLSQKEQNSNLPNGPGRDHAIFNGSQGQSSNNRRDHAVLAISPCMECFMPVVTTSVSDDTYFISPWDWGLPAMTHARLSAGSVVIGSELFVVGGTGPDGLPVSRVETFDFRSRTWNKHCVLANCNLGNVACVLAKCRVDRKRDGIQTDPWTKYRWVMW